MIILDDIWIVIPAYNEGRVIADVVKNVSKSYPNIAVVDDCSTDDTFAHAQSAGATVLHHSINLGQGAALQTGISFALARGAKFIVTFDADGQHQVDDINTLLKRREEQNADSVLGSRFLGETERMPAIRRFILKAAVIFMRLTSGLQLTDAHNGLRLFTRETAMQIRIRQNRMAHASEIINQLASMKVKVVEAPTKVVYTDYSMAKGQSSMNSFRILAELLVGRLSK